MFNLDKALFRRLCRFEFMRDIVAFAINISTVAALRLWRRHAQEDQDGLIKKFTKRILSLTHIGLTFLRRHIMAELEAFLTPYMLRYKKGVVT